MAGVGAAAGRKARPPALKLLEGRGKGTDSGGRKVKPAPAFIRLPPDAPATLGPIARAEWDRVVPELARLELLTPIMCAQLTAYCEMVETFVRATEEVHEKGLTVENRSVKKDGTESVWFTANPAVTVQRNAQAAVRAWSAEFALTPASAGKVSAPEGPKGEQNPFD